MSPAEIVAALAMHGTRIAVDGDRVRLVFKPGNPPPKDLIRAAREAKAALRTIATTMQETPRCLEPIGHWTITIQKWGKSLNEAAKIVNSLCNAAGAPGTLRRAHVGELFARMEARHRWGGSRKVEWLVAECSKMQSDKLYWPATRPDRTAKGRVGPERILRAMARAPGHQWLKVELQKAAGMSKNVISNLVLAMKKAGEIICVRPGVYALPQSGADNHLPACRAIVTALLSAPEHQAATAELVETTRLTRNAVDSAGHRMVEWGVLVRPKRGVFAFSPETLDKIRRGELVRAGHAGLELPQSLADLDELHPSGSSH